MIVVGATGTAVVVATKNAEAGAIEFVVAAAAMGIALVAAMHSGDMKSFPYYLVEVEVVAVVRLVLLVVVHGV